MTPQQEQKLRDEYLVHFKCINTDCDGKGNIPVQVGDGEWEAEQCQYCFEVRFATTDFVVSKLNKALEIQEQELKEKYEQNKQESRGLLHS